MKMFTNNRPNFASRWLSQFNLPLSARLVTVLFSCIFMGVFFVAGCNEEDPGIINVCLAPTVIRTSPLNGETGVALFKMVPANVPAAATGAKKIKAVTKKHAGASVNAIAAAKFISATFSTPMNPGTINTSTFIVMQGGNAIPGTVWYADTTALFVFPGGLGANLTYFCTITTGVHDVSGSAMAANYVWSFTTASAEVPTLLSPANLAINQSTSPTLIWNTIPGGGTYRLQVSSAADFSNLVYDDSTRVNSTQIVSGLSLGASYYWRVNSKIAGGTSGYSEVWKFTVSPASIQPPVLVSPFDGTINASTVPSLIWLSSAGAATYRLEVSSSSSFASTVYNDSTLVGLSHTMAALPLGTTFYWRVNAKNSAGTSAYSPTWSFTTIGAVPPPPTLIAPLNTAVNILTNPTLSWNVSPGASSYRLQVSTGAAFATTIYNDSTNAGTSQLISGLALGTTYYWRVNAKNNAGTSAYSPVWSFTTSVLALQPPVLVLPVDGATSVSTSPSLTWLASVGATTYRLQLSTSASFSTTVINDSTLSTLSQVITGLNAGTIYYWRVNAKNATGTSAYSNVSSFTSSVAVPPVPLLLAPLDVSINIATNPTLSWHPSAGAATYRLQVSTSAVFASTVLNDSTNTGTAQIVNGLALGTTYYWRVNAKNVSGTSSYSTVWSFTTSFTTLLPPVLVLPVDAAINVSTSPTLTWLASTGAVTYRLQLSKVSSFATTVLNDSTLSTLSHAVIGLSSGTTYYWRMNAKNANGTSAYSDVSSFTTAFTPPLAPLLLAPLDVSVNVSINPTLSWHPSAGAATYRLQVSTSAVFASTVLNDSTNTGTAQIVNGLALGTTYYWRVNAKNVSGTSPYSTVWSFTTSFTTLLPPVLVLPVDTAINVSTSPTLTWLASVGAVTYRLQLSKTSGFGTTVINDSTLNTLSHAVVGLSSGTTYFWRMNAKNANGTSAYSNVSSFTTAFTPPVAPLLLAPLDSAINVSINPSLSWHASIGAITYRLQVSTSLLFTTTVYNDSTNVGTAQLVSGLNLGTKYYWRVNAKNAGGTSAYSTVWMFTTSFLALQPPVLVAPLDAAINVSQTPTLSWLASTGAVTYRLQVDTSSVFASTVYDDSTIAGLSHLMASLTPDQTYFWRVNAKNAGGTSAYSTTWRFTIEAPKPLVDLGPMFRFGTFGGAAGATNQGIYTRINGNIGTTGASTLITGFHDGTAPPANVFTESPLNFGSVRDTIYTATAPLGSVPGDVATKALAAAQDAYNFLRDLPGGPDPAAGELGGLVLAPGTYTAAGGTFKITLLDLTLDAQGDPNAHFVFQMASSLTVGAAGPLGARSVILINGAQAKNIYWVAGTGGSGAATINASGGGTMVGTIIAYSGVTFSTVGNTVITTLNGRAIGLNASTTMVNTVINVPMP